MKKMLMACGLLLLPALASARNISSEADCVAQGGHVVHIEGVAFCDFGGGGVSPDTIFRFAVRLIKIISGPPHNIGADPDNPYTGADKRCAMNPDLCVDPDPLRPDSVPGPLPTVPCDFGPNGCRPGAPGEPPESVPQTILSKIFHTLTDVGPITIRIGQHAQIHTWGNKFWIIATLPGPGTGTIRLSRYYQGLLTTTRGGWSKMSVRDMNSPFRVGTSGAINKIRIQQMVDTLGSAEGTAKVQAELDVLEGFEDAARKAGYGPGDLFGNVPMTRVLARERMMLMMDAWNNMAAKPLGSPGGFISFSSKMAQRGRIVKMSIAWGFEHPFKD